MLTPVKMRRVELLVLDRDFAPLTKRLGDLGLLHLIAVGELGDWADRLGWPEVAVLAADYDALIRRLNAVLAAIALSPPEEGEDVPIAPPAELRRASAVLARIEPEVEQLLGRERTLDDEQARLHIIAAQLEMLRPLGVSLADLRNLTFLYATAGLVPQENLARLGESLRPIPHALVRVRRVGGRMLLFAFVPRAQAEVLERALRGAFVEKVDVPPTFTGTPEEALAELSTRRQELVVQRERLTADRAALGERYGGELRRLWRVVSLNRDAVYAWRSAGRTERTRLLAGWIPADRQEALSRAVAEVTAGRAVIGEAVPLPPGPEAETGRGHEPAVPTALRNPGLLRSFEGLVSTFGVPDYWAVDPTPVAALLFVIMFGAMFGDLGQGAVIVLAGILLATGRLPFQQRDFGVVLAACGISAMIFGVLYGSVFAVENVLPPLWMRPIDNIQFFIQLAIGFGALVVSVGLVLGVVVAWRRRDLRGVFFSPTGLAGLWLYWGLIILLVLAVTGRLSALLAVPLLGVPLLLIYLQGPLSRALGWGNGEGQGATYYVEAGVESFDVIIRFVSNTVSFLRIAAFALSHAGLGITVVALAEMLHAVPGASLLVLILGNALIVVLEALIVGIQALRLEYYEFFTKFLGGGGVPYRPFTLVGPSRGRS